MIVAVAEAPTAAQAATLLNLTPSALSHQMKKAEAALRVQLFERRGPRLQLTTAGRQVHAAGRVILAQLAETEEILERTRHGNRPAVRLGGGAYPVQRLLIPRLAIDDLSQVDFVTRTRHLPLVEALAEGEIDLALVCARVARPGISHDPLFSDDLVAVMHPRHPLAAATTLAAGAFQNATYVSYSRIVEDGLEDALLFRPMRRGPAHFVLAETVETMLDLVGAGVGFSILSRWALPAALTGLAVRPLTEAGARVTWSVVWRTHEKSAATLSLCERLRAALGNVEPARPPAAGPARSR